MPTIHPRVPGRVSIIIPTKDNQRTIAACVASARAQRGDVEVVVVDNRSTDATVHLAHRHGADQVLVAGPERSAQRNAGFESTTGEFVVFIDSDMVLDEGLAADVRDVFATDTRLGAAVLPETSFGEGYLAACRALEKRLYLGDPSAEAARAFRSAVLDTVGGYTERYFAFEDYELADRVRAAGWRIGRTGRGVRHDEGRVSLRALWRKKRYYGSQWHLVSTGSLDPRRLRRPSLAPRRLLADPAHLPGLAVLKAVDLSGLLAGHLAAQRSETARARRSPIASTVTTST